MKYLILSLLFAVGCSNNSHIIQREIDVSLSPDCTDEVINAEKGYEHFDGDDGSVMYFSKSTGDICLKRVK